MRVAIHHHQTKALPLAQALADAGHELVGELPADVLLLDADFPAYDGLIAAATAGGGQVFLYPHGLPINLAHDGIYNPDPRVRGQFVVTEGGAEVMRRIAYPGELHVIGWHTCPLLPYRGDGSVRRVLFAPLHPLPTGGLEPYMRINREVFEALLAVPGIEITVRHIRDIANNGLWEAPGVRFVEGHEDNSWAQIDDADVVVAGWGTFPCLSVARGCPTVTFAADVRPSNLEHGPGGREAANWERYRELLRYPIDFADGAIGDLLRLAASGEEPIRAWRERFVGAPWDPARFVARLERAVAEPPLDARDFVTVASAAEAQEDPGLLTRYAEVFTDAHDATLVLRAPGADPGQVVAGLERAGVDLAAMPDLVLETGASDDLVATRAVAVYGTWPVASALAGLPRFGAGDVPRLLERAEARWAARAARGA